MSPWLAAIRPKTLPAGAVPVVVGTAAAYGSGSVAWLPAAAALLGALLLQVGANLANDYHDWKNGADTPERLGPTRVTQAGLISPQAVRRGYWLAFGLALGVGVYLTTVAGWPIVAIGVGGLVCAYAYTGGPWPLGYHGLGDLLVFVFFGPVAVCGTYLVQAGHPPAWVLAASVPVGLLTTAILVVNNIRDIDTDRSSGKVTLAVRMGRRATRAYYLLLVVVAFCAPPALSAGGLIGPLGWACLVAAPLAVAPLRAVWSTTDGVALNRALAQTARLLLVHGVLFAIALSGIYT